MVGYGVLVSDAQAPGLAKPFDQGHDVGLRDCVACLLPLPVAADDASEAGDVATLAVHLVEHAVTVRANCDEVVHGGHHRAFEVA